MLKTDALIVDYGPTFHGTALKTGDGIVCVIPRQLQSPDEEGDVLREMVEGLGGRCGQCAGCPLGSLP
ncbi:hypothetical protein OG259_07915 [Streptomyces sp. NBC_00250]|uniref:hypothetical protein n=1 Tax=Streptomyces sp. NBC_00250 TaxID=2903641 RepID=UPI002E2AEE28|nr:hypothetical protein [Streptomyces sp. NBC_00250]